MKNTTTGLMESLLGTLEIGAFLKGVREFDGVTQRQCLLKARKELLKPRVSNLHGAERTKLALGAVGTALEELAGEKQPVKRTA